MGSNEISQFYDCGSVKPLSLLTLTHHMKYRYLPILIVLLIAVGCSDKVPLRGTITFSDDDSPLPTGTVFFVTPTFQAQGAIREDGSYIVGSERLTDGLPPGTYRIFLSGTTLVEHHQTRPLGQTCPVTGDNIDHRFQEEIRTSLLHERYRDPETSGLEVTVDRSTRTFNFQVERAP